MKSVPDIGTIRSEFSKLGNIKNSEVTAEGGENGRKGDLEALLDESKKFGFLR